jgi:hypothetical protein
MIFLFSRRFPVLLLSRGAGYRQQGTRSLYSVVMTAAWRVQAAVRAADVIYEHAQFVYVNLMGDVFRLMNKCKLLPD